MGSICLASALPASYSITSTTGAVIAMTPSSVQSASLNPDQQVAARQHLDCGAGRYDRRGIRLEEDRRALQSAAHRYPGPLVERRVKGAQTADIEVNRRDIDPRLRDAPA